MSEEGRLRVSRDGGVPAASAAAICSPGGGHEMANDVLKEWFHKQGHNTRDLRHDAGRVNRNYDPENLRGPGVEGPPLGAKLHGLMFDARGV